jgi:hypothetical protein
MADYRNIINLIRKITSPVDNVVGNVLEFIRGGEADRERGEGYLDAMGDEYTRLSGRAEELLDKPPQVDLQGYIDQLGGYGQDVLDEYLRSAGQVDDVSRTSLDDALGNYDASLNIGRLKDTGALNASTFAQMLGSETEGLRDLAFQSSAYKSERQNALGNAYAQMGQMRQGAYNNRIAALQSAAGMRGAGYEGAVGATGMQAGISQAQFQFNEFEPWRTGVNYYGAGATRTQPYGAGMQWHGELGAYRDAQRDAMIQGFQNIYSNFQEQGQQMGMFMAGNPGAVAGGGGYTQPSTPANQQQPPERDYQWTPIDNPYNPMPPINPIT